MNQYYVIRYVPDGEACPYYLSGNFSPEAWEFENVEPNPLEIEIKKQYSLKISDPEIKFLGFDYYDGEPRLVSARFLKICEELGVSFRAIPFDIKLKKGAVVDETYYIFLAGSNVSLLDVEQSAYTVEHVVETGEVMVDTIFPPNPVYSKIEKFIPKGDTFPALFFCIEIMKLVCNEEFRLHATELDLKGMEFLPIDGSYTYDFWTET